MGFILDILKDLPISAVLRERILQLESDILEVHQSKAGLEKKLAELEAEHLQTVREFEAYRRAHENFVEKEGMKFKRLDSGSYDETPYCINSAHAPTPMSVTKMCGGLISCPVCRRRVHMRPDELKKIVNALNETK